MKRLLNIESYLNVWKNKCYRMLISVHITGVPCHKAREAGFSAPASHGSINNGVSSVRVIVR